MAEELPSLQIDTDWKKQAQEEKRRLAEKAAAAKAAPPAPAAGGPGSASVAAAGGRAARRPGEREVPEPTFTALVNQLMTQALIYLGEIAYRGGPPMMDLDMARYQHDLLTMLEQKSANNLGDDERKFLDTALHEVRTRFIRAATEYIAY